MRAGLVFLSHQSFDINVNLSFFAQKIISPFLNPIFAQYHCFPLRVFFSCKPDDAEHRMDRELAPMNSIFYGDQSFARGLKKCSCFVVRFFF